MRAKNSWELLEWRAQRISTAATYYPVTFIKYGHHIMDFILMITSSYSAPVGGCRRCIQFTSWKGILSYSRSQIKDICKSLHSIIDPLEQWYWLSKKERFYPAFNRFDFHLQWEKGLQESYNDLHFAILRHFYYMYVKKLWPARCWCSLWTISHHIDVPSEVLA